MKTKIIVLIILLLIIAGLVFATYKFRSRSAAINESQKQNIESEPAFDPVVSSKIDELEKNSKSNESAPTPEQVSEKVDQLEKSSPVKPIEKPTEQDVKSRLNALESSGSSSRK